MYNWWHFNIGDFIQKVTILGPVLALFRVNRPGIIWISPWSYKFSEILYVYGCVATPAFIDPVFMVGNYGPSSFQVFTIKSIFKTTPS